MIAKKPVSRKPALKAKPSEPVKAAPTALPSDWAGKTPTPDQWRQILEAHAKWNRGEAGGSRAYLTRANLTRANLTRAYLTRADLTGADLTGADLTGAYLTRANLSRANLTGANLTGANLTGADLTWVNLTRANLTRAYLSGADLTGADLTEADLTGADLTGADLTLANLKDAKDGDLAIARTRILPEGRLIGWKRCLNGRIVKLAIPEAAKRSHAFGRKCRAEFAEVLEIEGATVAYSEHDPGFAYHVGKTVRPVQPWSEDWTEECASGIHFFITKAEAIAYQ